MQKKITFLSRHYPPNPNINGESIWDMVKYLKDNFDIDSNIICIDRTSEGGSYNKKAIGNVTRIKPIYQGQNPILRIISLVYDGIKLVRRAKKDYKDTIIVCTTSPPLLPFWCSLFLKNNFFWGLWALDLFPEGFVVTGKVKSSNFLYKWIKKKTYQGNPNFIIALGEQQAKHLQKEYKKDIPTIILPCGILFYQNKSQEQPTWLDQDKIILGYCGKLGDAHNPELLKAVIDALDPAKHLLVLAVYGNKANIIKEYIKGKEGIVLVDRVPRDQLHFIDIHLVTLIKSWTHIAVPSKAVSAIASNSCILFCGDQNSDNWSMFQKAGWFIDENDKISEQVHSLLKNLEKEEIAQKAGQTQELFEQLKSYVLNAYGDMSKLTKEEENSITLP